MDLKTFFENFDTIAEAPGGIEKLRSLILDLAVRGKLLSQFSTDSHSAIYLKKIEHIQTTLIQKKVIPKLRKSPPLVINDMEFTIPESWSWVKLSSVFDVRDGTHDSPKYVAFGIPLVTSKNISSGILDLSNVKYISREDHVEISKRSGVNNGDLLFAMIGSIGHPVIVNTEEEFSIKNVALFKSFDPNLYDLEYLRLYLLRSTELMQSKSAGGVQKFVSLGFLRNYPFAFPPLEEQKRIIEKVNELMALCDRLQAAQEKRDRDRQKLRASALDALMNAPTDDALDQAWAFVRDRWDVVASHPNEIGELRNLVLNLALRGKLTSQSHSDETTQTLIGELKTDVLSFNGESKFEKPWELPRNWSWVTLSQLGKVVGGGTPTKSNSLYWNGEIPWVSPKDMKVEFIEKTQDYISEDGLKSSSAKLIPEGSLLMVIRGMILAHSFPVALSRREVTINQDMKALILFFPEIGDYLLYALKGMKSIFLNFVQRSSHGTCRLPTENVFSQCVPLPPLAEQKRIVLRIDELMIQCDRLESSLRQSQEKASALASAAITSLEV